MRKKINTPPPPPKETRLKVAENTDLMSFLLAKMGGMSRNSIKSLLAHRQVMVNNEITTQFNFALKPNDSVIINSLRGNIELSHPKLKIIFEDQYLIVVEIKPEDIPEEFKEYGVLAGLKFQQHIEHLAFLNNGS